MSTGGVQDSGATDQPPTRERPRPLWWRLVRLPLTLFVLFWLSGMTGCMERLFFYPTVEPTPPPAQFDGAERMHFNSADGTPLVGWFIPSQHADHPPGSAATILHTHGNAGSMNSHLPFVDHLPAAGFNLFLFDYRGYGESGGRTTRRKHAVADAHAAIDALLARNDIDLNRIGLFGQSLGGAVGIEIMAQRTEIKAAVIVSVFSSWRNMGADAISPTAPAGPFAGALAWLLLSDRDRPVDLITTIDRPILLMHGTADTVVPPYHSDRLAAAGADNVKLRKLEGADHNRLFETHPEARDAIAEFFHEHLTSDQPAPVGAGAQTSDDVS